ncbi:MAG: hypothetical protein SFZ02_16405, partial [bacterium]|nr:hypothetical protein [bacterium]
MTSITEELIQKESNETLAVTMTSASFRLIPQRWYVHVVLWIACFIIGFPLFYAMLVSTQNNAQVINFQILPGDSFENNWQSVMIDRNLGRYM